MKDTLWKRSDLDPLSELGLSKNQAIIYLTLLQRGLSTATELSRITKINRQQVYAEMDKLLEYGLVDITKKLRKKFIGAHPSTLVRLAEKRKTEAQTVTEQITKMLPFLESIRTTASKKASIKYFDGMKRIQEAYAQELAQCHDTEVLSFVGSIEDLFHFFPEKYWDKWNEAFIKRNNSSRMLVDGSTKAKETTKQDTKFKRETRFLSPFPLRVNIDVFGDTVLIVSVHDEMALWINSAIISESYRILFQTCWIHAKSF